MVRRAGGLRHGARPGRHPVLGSPVQRVPTWGTEIGSFNLADPRRYDLLPAIAARLGIPTGEDNPLWRDQAVVEANRAVLHSFRKAGVRILDHHTLSDYFLRFQAEEHRQNRPVYGHWPWIVPPMSSNLSDIWHDARLKKVILKPNYFYQPRGGWLQSLGEGAAQRGRMTAGPAAVLPAGTAATGQDAMAPVIRPAARLRAGREIGIRR